MKRILAIGGGELKNRETLSIDEYIAAEAKKAAQGKATVSSGTPGKAQALIAELMKARGLDAPEKTEDAPAAGGGKGSASGGVGDISDIL